MGLLTVPIGRLSAPFAFLSNCERLGGVRPAQRRDRAVERPPRRFFTFLGGQRPWTRTNERYWRELAGGFISIDGAAYAAVGSSF